MASEVELERMVIRLIGDAESYCQMLKEAEEGTEETAKTIEDLGERIEGFANDLEATGKKLSLAITAPIMAMGGLATAAYGIQEQAEITLQGIMDANGRATATLFKDYAAFSSHLQELTVTGDETTLAMFRTAESLGITGGAAKVAIKEAMGLGAAIGMSTRSAIRYTAALADGDTMMLNRYIPALKMIEDQDERVAEAHKRLGRMFAVAEAAAQTFIGSLTQLYNATGDLFEQFGAIIAKYMKPFIGVMKQAVLVFQAMPGPAKEIVVVLAALAATIGPLLIGLGLLTKLLLLAESGLMAMNVAILLTKVHTVALFIAMKAATVATIMFHAMSGPRGWAIIAGGIVAATGAILVYTLKMREASAAVRETGAEADKAGKTATRAMDEAKSTTDAYTASVRKLSKAIGDIPAETQNYRIALAGVEKAQADLREMKAAFASEEELVRQQAPRGPRPKGALERAELRKFEIDIAGAPVGRDVAMAYIEGLEQTLAQSEERLQAAFRATLSIGEEAIDTSGAEKLLDELTTQQRDLDIRLRGGGDVEIALANMRQELEGMDEEAFEFSGRFGGREGFFLHVKTTLEDIERDRKKLEAGDGGQRLIEQFATPFEIAKKKIADYVRMVRAAAIDEGTFRRASKAAIKEYQQAMGSVERIAPQAMQTIQRGSVAEQLLIQESRLAMTVQQPTEAQDDSRNLGDIATATKNTALGIDALVKLAQDRGLLPADLAGSES